ncbi:MAG: ATP-binding protein [Hydrogenophaga sp.]|uniref:ATP-binding protein n=1 Tax=Hydrogenophaga sp. TaxID=1904254 RepID=UPI003D9BE714
MKARARSRSFAVLVVGFTLVATGLLWWQTLHSQAQLREQVLLQAEQRSLHLADAMAGQVQAQLNTMDVSLKDLRDHWERDPRAKFDALAKEVLANLPPGLASHVSVADARGNMTYNSLGLEASVNVADRAHFQALRAGADALRLSSPVRSRLTGEWSFLVGRPLLRGGRFDGAVYLVVQSAQVARLLQTVELSGQDVVSMIHPDGQYLARSQGNETSMGKPVPANRPFRVDPALVRGTYRVDDALDHAPRIYGWRRLRGSELVVSVGLDQSAVLAPLAPALQRNLLTTGVLSLLLLGLGGVVVRDHVQAVRQQRALARSEARLNEAQQLAHVGNWEMDLESGAVVWSDEVFRIFEADPARTETTFRQFLEWVHPDDRAMVRQTFEASIKDHQPYNEVHRLLLPGGRIKWVRERGVTEYQGEQAVRTRGTVQDVTEVRLAQQALEQLNEQLETRVSERTRELAQANRELEAFTYSVSHDLRTPLRSIHGFAAVLEEEEAEHLSDAGRKHLRRIQDGSRRMGQLITDLLSLAHLNRAQMQQVPVDLSELAWQVAGEFQRSEPEREVDWQIQDGLQAMADPGLMRVVLHNLLGNAWKYTGQTPQARIAFTLEERQGGMATFCVRDNGAGFDMAYAAQLFQPFRRLHAHHEFEGSGVGLATVSRVIRRHGGQVRGEGAVGQGAAFHFSLPDVPVASDLTTW